MKLHEFFAHFRGESLTFDDLILMPGYIDFALGEIDFSVQLTRSVSLGIPLMSAPMDTVTESAMAIALGLQGGLGIIHYNMPPRAMREQLLRVRSYREVPPLLTGAAVEIWPERARERLEAIADVVDVIVFDTAQGHSSLELDLIRWTKQHYPHLQVIGGNVVTASACRDLIEAGVDAVRVGMGIGSICTTQGVCGVGRGQASAIYACAQTGIPVIADGGLRSSADIVKALALGASCVMSGSLLAGTDEAAGERQMVGGRPVKQYRGMGSLAAMARGSAVRYGVQESRRRIPEGVLGALPSRGSVADWVPQLMQGVKQGMHKAGFSCVADFSEREVELERRSSAAMREGEVHTITAVPEQRVREEELAWQV